MLGVIIMLCIHRTIKVNQDVSVIDKPIVLYKGDHDVIISLLIINQNEKLSIGFNMIGNDTTHARLVLVSPNTEVVMTNIVECENGVADFIIGDELLGEIGKYSFQIRLYDYDNDSLVTIPKVKDGLVVREPISYDIFNVL